MCLGGGGVLCGVVGAHFQWASGSVSLKLSGKVEESGDLAWGSWGAAELLVGNDLNGRGRGRAETSQAPRTPRSEQSAGSKERIEKARGEAEGEDTSPLGFPQG